jgi:hypothetical protein
VTANIVFVAAWLLAAAWQGPNYSVAAHTISDMYADGAPGAWFLILIFTLCGAAAQYLFADYPQRAADGLTAISDTGRRALAELRSLLDVLDGAPRSGRPDSSGSPI